MLLYSLLDSCVKLGSNDLEEMKSKYVVWIYHSGFLLIGVLIVGVIAASCFAVAFYLTVGFASSCDLPLAFSEYFDEALNDLEATVITKDVFAYRNSSSKATMRNNEGGVVRILIALVFILNLIQVRYYSLPLPKGCISNLTQHALTFFSSR